MIRRLSVLAAVLATLTGCNSRCCTPCAPCATAPAPVVVVAAPAPTTVPAVRIAAVAPALDSEDPQVLLAALAAGNQRYRDGSALHSRQDAARRTALANTQTPKVVVLACADSRVAPEILFDQGLGDLFVIRVAGNVASAEVTASIEYAVEHLGSKLVVVLGHERCGAVKAALAGGELPGHLPALMALLAPAVAAVPAGTPDRESATVAMNAKLTAEGLAAATQPVLGGAVAHHHVAIVPGVYDLDTGAVTFMPTVAQGLPVLRSPGHLGSQ